MTTKKSKRPTIKLQKVQRAMAVQPVIVQKKKKSKPPKAKAGKGLMGLLGGAAGTYFGGPLGGILGQAAGNVFSHVTGFGDYKVNENSITGGVAVPSFKNGDGVKVCHEEFISNVLGSVGFALTSYSINPGLAGTFPLLSLITQSFEEYEMRGLLYAYKPTSGTAVSAASAALGVVVMATDYDALNASFTSKQQMESYQFANSTAPFSSALHPIECKRGSNVLMSQYLRSGSIPTGADLRLYDMGNFQIATEGMQSVYAVGELWVTYDVLLRKPRIPPAVSVNAFAHVQATPFGTATDTGGQWLGTSGGQLTVNSSLPGVFVEPSVKQTVVFSVPGTYFFLYVASGTVGGVTSSFSTGGNIITSPYNWYAGQSTNTLSSTNVGGAFCLFTGGLVVNVGGTGAANRVQFATAGVGSLVAGNADVFIFPAISNNVFESVYRTLAPTRPKVVPTLCYPLSVHAPGGSPVESLSQDEQWDTKCEEPDLTPAIDDIEDLISLIRLRKARLIGPLRSGPQPDTYTVHTCKGERSYVKVDTLD